MAEVPFVEPIEPIQRAIAVAHPIKPPEVDPIMLARGVTERKKGLEITAIAGIVGESLPACRIGAYLTHESRIKVFERGNARGRMVISGHVNLVFMEPF